MSLRVIQSSMEYNERPKQSDFGGRLKRTPFPTKASQRMNGTGLSNNSNFLSPAQKAIITSALPADSNPAPGGQITLMLQTIGLP